MKKISLALCLLALAPAAKLSWANAAMEINPVLSARPSMQNASFLWNEWEEKLCHFQATTLELCRSMKDAIDESKLTNQEIVKLYINNIEKNNEKNVLGDLIYTINYVAQDIATLQLAFRQSIETEHLPFYQNRSEKFTKNVSPSQKEKQEYRADQHKIQFLQSLKNDLTVRFENLSGMLININDIFLYKHFFNESRTAQPTHGRTPYHGSSNICPQQHNNIMNIPKPTPMYSTPHMSPMDSIGRPLGPTYITDDGKLVYLPTTPGSRGFVSPAAASAADIQIAYLASFRSPSVAALSSSRSVTTEQPQPTLAGFTLCSNNSALCSNNENTSSGFTLYNNNNALFGISNALCSNNENTSSGEKGPSIDIFKADFIPSSTLTAWLTAAGITDISTVKAQYHALKKALSMLPILPVLSLQGTRNPLEETYMCAIFGYEPITVQEAKQDSDKRNIYINREVMKATEIEFNAIVSYLTTKLCSYLD